MRLGRLDIMTLLRALFIAGCVGMLSSCVFDRDSEPEMVVTDSSDMQAGLRISLGEPKSYLRAIPTDGPYDDGRSTPFENYIDISLENPGYRVLFFDSDDKYLAAFKPTKVVALDEDPMNSKTYDVVGEIDNPLPRSFKVVILANWRHFDQLEADLKVGVTTINDICTAEYSKYSYEAPFNLSTENTIPMYGVKACTDVVFRNGLITFLGTVHLLRAMAKVEVMCSSVGWTLETVRLNKYQNIGYCAPKNVVREEDYVTGSYVGDYTKEVHIIDNNTALKTEPIAFQKVRENHFYIYIPEFNNAVDGEKIGLNDINITVAFAERTGKTYDIEFKYYNLTERNYFDVMRNYDYRFNVTKLPEDVEGEEDPTIEVDLYPYDQYELYPEFGL